VVIRSAALALLLAGSWELCAAETPPPAVVQMRGTVEVAKAGGNVWTAAKPGQALAAGDRVRTGENSGALVRLADMSIWQMTEISVIGIEAPPQPQSKLGLFIERGLGFFFGRDKRETVGVRTRTVSGAVRGTEFNVSVAEDGTTVLTLLEGEMELTAAGESLGITNRGAAIVEPGKPPRRTPILEAVNIIQWSLYYPGVLDLSELSFDGQAAALQPSFDAWRKGDILQALATYPAERVAASDAEKIYRAALLLAGGEIEKAQPILQTLPASPQADALRQLIAAVKFQSSSVVPATNSATALLAASYYEQSRSTIPEALALARRAKDVSPQFGFAWERVAELEFSSGRNDVAENALDRALELSPRNAQAIALKGFLLAARNRPREAIEWFDRAIAADSRLGNAWLGRGLCRIRIGDSRAGLEDLEVAAATEPNRAVLRSYLGKAFYHAGDTARATNELKLARDLDANDPTAWLYSALLKQQENRINEAIHDLEISTELNENRSVYRSQMQLDQDRAVRSANLANIYLDAGMIDVSVREAVRAVNYDYANYSAHLFLANSYDRLRDPKQINLRYETPWFSEYLMANLLAPVGAGTLSQNVSQQEYSKLFERDGFGVVNSTEYFSSGDWTESATHYGRFRNSAYAVDVSYRSDNGQRPNNDFEQTTISLQLKQQLTLADSVYLQIIGYGARSGDVVQYYRDSQASHRLRTTETQKPIVFAGYHHEWTPGVHTLLLASRADDTAKFHEPNTSYLFLDKDINGTTRSADVFGGLDSRYRSQLEIYSVELQQIFEQPKHTTILGARYQNGDFETRSRQSSGSPTALDSIDPDFERMSVYAYHHWLVHPKLMLVGGVSYDHLEFPLNYRFAPLHRGEEENNQLSPKGGVIWTPFKGSTVRAGYTRSLGGVSFDQSFRLEPTQVAGFNQAFRSIIPESIAAANANAEFETYGLSLEQKLPTKTYLGLSLEALNSEVGRSLGIYQMIGLLPPTTGRTREHLDFEERTLALTVNQLVGEDWAFGTRYQLSRATLDDRFTSIPATTPSTTGFRARTEPDALLHQLTLFAIYNHSSGFFARAESAWYSQDNDGYTPHEVGDDFWQFNLFAGYRFLHRHAEVQVGLLNVTDQNYRLNPLNLYYEAPRERTFVARLQFNF
jgi:tetratricopeptide (TPR) repeat protein